MEKRGAIPEDSHLDLVDVHAGDIGDVQQRADAGAVDANEGAKGLQPPHIPMDQ